MRSREWNKLDVQTQDLIRSIQRELPVKLGELSKKLGLTVKVSTMPANVSGQISPDHQENTSFVIKVNRHEYKTRQRFTLAHEISHYLLHRDLIGDGIEDNILYRSNLSDSIEAQANRLAADILMPWYKLEYYLKSAPNQCNQVEDLAKIFGVSEHAMRIRLGK